MLRRNAHKSSSAEFGQLTLHQVGGAPHTTFTQNETELRVEGLTPGSLIAVFDGSIGAASGTFTGPVQVSYSGTENALSVAGKSSLQETVVKHLQEEDIVVYDDFNIPLYSTTIWTRSSTTTITFSPFSIVTITGTNARIYLNTLRIPLKAGSTIEWLAAQTVSAGQINRIGVSTGTGQASLLLNLRASPSAPYTFAVYNSNSTTPLFISDVLIELDIYSCWKMVVNETTTEIWYKAPTGWRLIYTSTVVLASQSVTPFAVSTSATSSTLLDYFRITLPR